MTDRQADIKILVSLNCTMCPDVVSACQNIAIRNKNVTCKVYDIHYCEEMKKKYNVMSVPCVIIDDRDVYFGRKSTDQIMELIEK